MDDTTADYYPYCMAMVFDGDSCTYLRLDLAEAE